MSYCKNLLVFDWNLGYKFNTNDLCVDDWPHALFDCNY